jgi:hypothetical protein
MMVNGGGVVSRKQMSYFYALVKAYGKRLDKIEEYLNLTPLDEQPAHARKDAQESKEGSPSSYKQCPEQDEKPVTGTAVTEWKS